VGCEGMSRGEVLIELQLTANRWCVDISKGMRVGAQQPGSEEGAEG
jgi:hypothetical protein